MRGRSGKEKRTLACRVSPVAAFDPGRAPSPPPHLRSVVGGVGALQAFLTLSLVSSGISGKSQLLFALVFTTRYLDLFTSFISLYNTSMKVGVASSGI